MAAATVVLLRPGPRGPEVLLTKRPASMAFGPDIHVFPGGRVDDQDRDPSVQAIAGLSPAEAARRLGLDPGPDAPLTPAEALAHHLAAVRETAEETGIRIAARDLVALSRWVTPPSMPRRFDVRIFGAFVDPGTGIERSSAEVADSVWLRPGAALAMAGRGTIELWQPTYVTLQQLEDVTDLPALREAFVPGAKAGGPTFHPVDPGIVRLDAPWAGGIPGRQSTGWLVGRREIVVVDPGDPTGTTTEAVVERVTPAGGRLAGVLVGDFTPERHAGVEMFAHGLGLAVHGPAALASNVPYPVIGLEPGAPIPIGDVAFSLDALATLRSRRTRSD